MKTITGERGAGKTDRLIELAAEHGHYIACHSRAEVMRVARRARELELDIRFPITYLELIQYRGHNVPVLIDNVQEYVKHTTLANIAGIALDISDDHEALHFPQAPEEPEQ